ncbi:MAG TPA: DegT/DnrJ/EryC1/StrS family aminotransferase [Burkholderiaceae bacterium]|nr:DegT/DnrJ/EryC1/StrS family aminotransferase [Burkholderiaceae bacterium]
MITFFDFKGRHPDAARDIIRLVREQAARGEFILKSAVLDFEQRLSEHTGARHAICTSSGTAGLALSLRGLGIGPGDEVVVPAFCYVAVASAVVLAGARPVFADVDPERFTIDPSAVQRAITLRTRAVLAAHVFSAIADMDGLNDALPDGVALVEDAATAFGARDARAGAGRMGDVGVLSFFPAKPLGGLGDAGAVLTDDDELARRVRMLRNHGQDGITRFVHHMAGHNMRMDDINARWLTERLPGFAQELAHKQRLAHRYDEMLTPLAPRLTLQRRGTEVFSPHAYVVRTGQRDALRAHLSARGIETRVHFGAALPDQPAFRADASDCNVPVARVLACETLALPLHPALSLHDIDVVAAAVQEFFA